jgi:hypothetical protein
MVRIKHNLRVAQDRQKSYADKNMKTREFKVGENVVLKVKPKNSSLKLSSCTNLATIFGGPFEILDRIGPVEYMLALLSSMNVHNVFHVSLLKNYVHDSNHAIDWILIPVDPERDFQVQPVCILERKVKIPWNRVIELVKVQWTCYSPEDATWEHRDAMCTEYLQIFE